MNNSCFLISYILNKNNNNQRIEQANIATLNKMVIGADDVSVQASDYCGVKFVEVREGACEKPKSFS